MIKKAIINPTKKMALLSQYEIERLKEKKNTNLYNLFKACSLAVLSSNELSDDPEELLEKNKMFDIEILQKHRGVQIELTNAPASSFIDGELIEGIKENLFAIVRDILCIESKFTNIKNDIKKEDITNYIFNILRNTQVMIPRKEPNLIVCWGGHSIPINEYEHTKEVGYQLGLRNFDICTGCGIGAMKGPMKGAVIAHQKTRYNRSRFIGISEPGIIASESPNPIVNNLIVMPDIEKRLESFVRLSHGVIIFPGGVGTAEELLYLIGILLNPKNKDIPFPVILTAPKESMHLMRKFDDFIRETIGEEGASKYKILSNPEDVAKELKEAVEIVKEYRIKTEESFCFNWQLEITEDFQKPFPPIHEEIKKLEINRNLPKHILAANLRRLFSIIVAGNVKPEGIEAVKKYGKFELNCEPFIMEKLESLLELFIKENRMKLPSDKEYEPCYRLKKED